MGLAQVLDGHARKDVANAMGIDISTISRWITREGVPSEKKQVLLAEYLGIPKHHIPVVGHSKTQKTSFFQDDTPHPHRWIELIQKSTCIDLHLASGTTLLDSQGFVEALRLRAITSELKVRITVSHERNPHFHQVLKDADLTGDEWKERPKRAWERWNQVASGIDLIELRRHMEPYSHSWSRFNGMAILFLYPQAKKDALACVGLEMEETHPWWSSYMDAFAVVWNRSTP